MDGGVTPGRSSRHPSKKTIHLVVAVVVVDGALADTVTDLPLL